jgi:hypothetical protein
MTVLMSFPKRVRWLGGKYANVDGIPFAMPVGTRSSPALFAGFAIDADRAAEMLPGQELFPVRLFGHGVLILAVVNYLNSPIGKYVEYCIGILATRGYQAAPTLPALLFQKHFGTGVYIYDLPVSTEISVKGGLGIFGMPKRQGHLDYVIGERTVSTQYDLDDQLVMRLDIPRPRFTGWPLRLEGVSYGDFRGMLFKSYIHLRGHMGMHPGGRGARLLLGDHPRMDPIRRLDINPKALFTGFAPTMDGVLDDHVESWYLTADALPPAPSVGLADVAGLTLSQAWLAPPDRMTSDLLMARLSPDERVGHRQQPLAHWLSPSERSAS